MGDFGGGSYASGSAAFVEIPSLPGTHDYIVSAAHVFESSPGVLLTNAALHIMSPDNQIIFINPSIATVIHCVAADITILQVEKVPERYRLSLSDMTNIHVGTTLYCMGYTRGVDHQNITICNIKDMSYRNEATPVGSILVDSVSMAGGNSGGPWVDSNGALVAIGSWGYQTPLPNHTHISSTGPVNYGEAGIYVSDFAESFNIFGVSVESLKRLINVWVTQAGGAVPYRYPGKTLGDNLAQHEIVDVLLGGKTWHPKLSGFSTNGAETGLPSGAVITEIETNEGFKEIGVLDSQYKNWDLDMFYSPYTTVNVRYVTPGGQLEGPVTMRFRTSQEDNSFVGFHHKKTY